MSAAERLTASVEHAVPRLQAAHRIAWRTIPRDQPATLDFFMNDYVDHLEHHLGQIFGRDTMSV